MAGPGPWSVKGIDDETRGVAREAAEHAGLPIGVWIDRAILKAAVDVPRSPEADPAKPMSPETMPLAGATAKADVAGADDPPKAVPVLAETAPAPPAAPAGVRPLYPVDASPRSTGAPAALSVASGAGPLDVPPFAAHASRRPSVLHERPVRRRSETLRYAFAGVFTVIAVAVGANYLDQIMPPGASVAERPAEQTADASVPRPAEPVQSASAPPAQPAAPEAASVSAAGSTPSTKGRLEQLTVQASGGDVAAQHELALLYSADGEVPKDEKRAAEWFEKAAHQGFPPAQYNLGVVYEQGRGVELNAQMAFSWYKSAADQGYGRAQHNLGTLYATGNGIAQNYDEAAKWFSRAADSGVAESLYSLGLMHEHGLGVAHDEAKARVFYQRASEAGVAEAARKLAALPKRDEEDLAAAGRAAERIEPSAGPAETRGAESDKALDRKETAELQRLLRRLDFTPGSSDGVAGRRTVAAIKLYQEFAGLPVDGRATRSLLEDIRQVTGALGQQPRTAGQ